MSTTLVDLPEQGPPLTEIQRGALVLLASNNHSLVYLKFIGQGGTIINEIESVCAGLAELGYAHKHGSIYYITDAGYRALKRRAAE